VSRLKSFKWLLVAASSVGLISIASGSNGQEDIFLIPFSQIDADSDDPNIDADEANNDDTDTDLDDTDAIDPPPAKKSILVIKIVAIESRLNRHGCKPRSLKLQRR